MSGVLAVGDAATLETRQERARRRIAALGAAFQTVFETLAEIYRDEDWRYVNDAAGRPYSGFTAFVADQLGCASSNARRYQQGITSLVLPLQEIAGPGTRIPVTSADVVRLGVTGAKVVVEEAAAVLEGVQDSEQQTAVLRELIDTVAKRSTVPGFGPLVTSPVTESPLGALVPSALPPLPAGRDSGASGDDADWPQFSAPAGPASGADEPVWVSQTPDSAAPQQDSTATRPAATVRPGTTLDLSGPDRDGAAADRIVDKPGSGGDEVAALEAAISAILAADDPASLADRIPRNLGTHLAGNCAAAAQRLARLGQVLRSLAA